MFVTNRKTFVYGFSVLLLLGVFVPVHHCQDGVNTQVANSLGKSVIGIANAIRYLTRGAYVLVENQGRHHAHLWCASADDKIGGDEGVWVPPGQSLRWSFNNAAGTQFWCNMDWYGRRYGWDVYVNNWGGDKGEWIIRDDGVYEGGGAKRLSLESNIPV